MKSFTFKIKKRYYNETLYALHCPYDVLYDSVKNSDFLKGHNFFITHEEILTDQDCNIDVFDGDVDALFNSDDIKDWLLNPVDSGEVNNDGNDE